MLAYLLNHSRVSRSFLPSSITNVCRVCHLSINVLQDVCFEEAARVAISYSYRIFNAHSSDVSKLLNFYSLYCMIVIMLQCMPSQGCSYLLSACCVPLRLGPLPVIMVHRHLVNSLHHFCSTDPQFCGSLIDH